MVSFVVAATCIRTEQKQAEVSRIDLTPCLHMPVVDGITVA